MSTPQDPQHGAEHPDRGAEGGGQQPGASGQQPGQYAPGQPRGYGSAQEPPRYGYQQQPPGAYEQPGQYGQAGQYGQQPGQPGAQGQQPGQYGGRPYPGQPYGGQPYSGDKDAYAYSPYGGTPYPAGLSGAETGPAQRPGIMIVSLILLILSALPFAAFGAILLVVPLDESVIPSQVLDDPNLVAAGATPELLITAFRVVGGVALVLALLYVLFAVLAFQGRNWARILLTVMTAAFTLLLLYGLFSGAGSDAGSLVFLLLVVAASVGGVVILFMPDPSRYFSGPRV